MISRCYLSLLSLLLLACEARKPTTEVATGPAAAGSLPPAPPVRLAAADTVVPFPGLQAPVDSVAGLPAVRLGGQTYRVETAVRTDPARRPPAASPSDTAAAARADSLARVGGYVYDALYTIRLLGAGGKARFVTTLRKPDFAAALGAERLALYATSAPAFRVFLPAFNSLVFEVHFFTPDTDDVASALLLLDATTGRVLQVVPYEQWDDADGANTLATDGRALLTGQDLLLADGRRVSLTRPGRQVAATRWLNDQVLLVAYVEDYEAKNRQDAARGHNAHLLDCSGRELEAFRLAGLEAEVGFRLRDEYLGQTRTYYLFDEENQTLRLFPCNQPLRYRTLPLARLPRFAPPQHPTEVHFTVYSTGGLPPIFYVDTLSGAVRYQPAVTF